MFTMTIQQNINFGMNPFMMGGMNIFANNMALPPANPFMFGSIFSCPAPMFNSCPSIFPMPMMPVMPQIPVFQFPFFGLFGLNNINSIFNRINNNSNNTTTDDTSVASSTKSKIKSGLLKGNLKGKEQYITYLCEKYGVDVGVVVSIICQESDYGRSNLAQHNNFMGCKMTGDAGKSSKGFGYFSTPEKGLEAGIKNLANYPKKYKNKGITKIDFDNIDAIGKIYCEGNTYANELRKIYTTTVQNYLV